MAGGAFSVMETPYSTVAAYERRRPRSFMQAEDMWVPAGAARGGSGCDRARNHEKVSGPAYIRLP